MKYVGPKVRVSRALGIALTPKAAKVMEHKPYPPGQHGQQNQRRRRESDYKRQLLEKQRLRAQYNIHERQMRNYYRKAVRMTGNTQDNIVRLLEARLDAVVYRSGLAPTIYAARQYVSHRHITVNGKIVNIPSFQVRVGQVVAVKAKSRQLPCFQEAVSHAKPPAYLQLDTSQFQTQLAYLPERDEVPIICELVQVIEYYARRK